MNERERALSLAEVVAPDWPRWSAKAGMSATKWLKNTPGVVGAWIEAAALHDDSPQASLALLVLMDGGCEISDALEVEGVTLEILGICADVLADTLEIDADLVEILANGYRLCGVQREVFELASLACEIAGV